MSEFAPIARLKECTFQLMHRQALNALRGGNASTVTLGSSYWMARFLYENMNDAETRAFRAFIARRRGRLNPFWAMDKSRKAPLNTPNQTNSGLTLTLDLASDPNTLRIDGVSSGTLSEGDLIGYRTADTGGTFNGRYLGEVVSIEAEAAGYQTFTMEPTLRPAHATPSLRVLEPFATMLIDPQSVQIRTLYDGFSNASFNAVQVQRGV